MTKDINNLEENKKLYQKYYSFEKFCEMFEADFDKRNGETCEKYYEDFANKRMTSVRLNIQFEEYEINLIEYVSGLGAIVLPPKGKYEALRFKIGDKIYILHRRFRSQTHYRFDSNFTQLYCEI